MKIESVDAFYLRLPEVRAIGDGSQDALLIRIVAGGHVGWGECEAAPLPTIAALIAPMSHSACRPVLDSLLGAELDGPESISAIHDAIQSNGMDMLQTDHALSGIDIDLWDLIGKREKAPVWSFFAATNRPKVAYASQLFGDTPADTFRAAEEVAKTSFQAAKFGWGPIGTGTLTDDIEQFRAAKEGLGQGRTLLIDTGCVFGHDVGQAALRIKALEEICVGWWEEPFSSGALAEYAKLSSRTSVPIAAGEGAHNADQAKHLIDYGCVKTIQIDTGRIGGITSARDVAVYAQQKGVPYVNHTFTSNLALSASLQPYADMEGLAEVPVESSELAQAIGGGLWAIDPQGHISAPDLPGLGLTPDLDKISPYLQTVEITIQGNRIWPQTRADQ